MFLENFHKNINLWSELETKFSLKNVKDQRIQIIYYRKNYDKYNICNFKLLLG